MEKFTNFGVQAHCENVVSFVLKKSLFDRELKDEFFFKKSSKFDETVHENKKIVIYSEILQLYILLIVH